MAKFFEYQGKAHFSSSGIPIPEGMAVDSPEEARQAAEKIGRPVVVKAQVWAGGRGKSGAVKFADTPDEAQKVAAEILELTIAGDMAILSAAILTAAAMIGSISKKT